MTIEEEIEVIKKKHNGSFKTLCTIYLKNGRFHKSKQMWGSVIITFALSIAAIICFLIYYSLYVLLYKEQVHRFQKL